MTTYKNDDARWDAMRAKDRAAEGAFYIGVHTTGVYCVASCGGRPLRKNVSFYPTRDDACAAGLRACLRCKPDINRETLRWAVGETSLGLALVARSDAGLRLVTLGDDAQALEADLGKRFKHARIVPDAEGLAADLKAVADLIDHPDHTLALPIDDQGTELQKAVWAALREIPAGQTASYADVIVSGGKGLKNPDNFKLVFELARVLGGEVGATRPCVQAGWVEAERQVGQTGKTVRPKLYIAAGISGAIQHRVGMESSDVIVAINTDPNAPIFDFAHYGIVGNALQVLPALTAAFAEHLGKRRRLVA